MTVHHQAHQGWGDYLYAHSVAILSAVLFVVFIVTCLNEYRQNPETYFEEKWAEFKAHFTLRNLVRDVVIMPLRMTAFMMLGVVAVAFGMGALDALAKAVFGMPLF